MCRVRWGYVNCFCQWQKLITFGVELDFLFSSQPQLVRCSCRIIRLLCVECTQRHSFMGTNEIVVWCDTTVIPVLHIHSFISLPRWLCEIRKCRCPWASRFNTAHEKSVIAFRTEIVTSFRFHHTVEGFIHSQLQSRASISVPALVAASALPAAHCPQPLDLLYHVQAELRQWLSKTMLGLCWQCPSMG